MKHMTIRAALYLFLLAVPRLVYSAAEGKDIRLLASDASGVVLEFTPRYLPLSILTKDKYRFTRFDFDHSRRGPLSTPGEPDLRCRSTLLELPGLGGNSVEVLQREYEDVQGVLLLPVATAHEGEVSPIEVLDINATAYGRPEFVPEEIAELMHVSESRGAVFGELSIYPLQYNAAARVVRKYTRIVVRVNFGGSTRAGTRPDLLVQGTAVNDNRLPLQGMPQVLPKRSVLSNSVLSNGPWLRFSVTESGMYKLSGTQMLAAGIPASTDPNTVRIFGNGGYETPTSVNSPFVDDLLENAVYVHDGGTIGRLDAGDYVVFYGKGTRGWLYNGANKSFTHYINHYTETNIYWLTYGSQPAKRMDTAAVDLNQQFSRPVTVAWRMFREDDMVNLLSSGLEWVGQSFNAGDQMVYVHPLFGLDNSQPISYRFHVGARSSDPSTFTIREHSTVLTTVGLAGTAVGDYFSRQFKDAIVSVSRVANFTDGQSQLRFAFASPSLGGNGYIDWYEITYRRFLSARNDDFSFFTGDTTASVQYAVGGFSGGSPVVFDVTRFDSVVVIPSALLAPDTCLFQLPLSAGGVREIDVVGENGFRPVASLARVSNQNLHGDPEEADYIIIAPTEFMPAAQRLKAYREQPGSASLRTLVVDVNQIYNEFGGGLPMPAAVRNYLRYVYNNWSARPKYVLLFGDGDFDYKRVIASGPNWILPWETAESFYPLLTYASDDDYVTFDAGRRVALGVGRLTARTPEEASTMVDKIIEYETNPVTDPWKARVTFVADDGLAGAGESNNLFLHTSQAEALSNEVPKLFEEPKIYEYEYPAIYTAGGRRKPEVNTAIRNQIDEGTLILNFTGHGNPRLWTHEAIFVRETDFPLLHNKGKYFILVAATCNYGYFDAVNDQSGGELLVSMPNAGAAGGFYSNRVVFAGDNFDINESIFRYMFSADTSGHILPTRLGDVIYRTKQDNFGGTADNDRKFYLLGDPAMHVAFPKMFASVDSIDQVPGNQVVQLEALSTASVKATVRDSASNPQQGFSGKALLVVYDSKRTVYLEDFIDTTRFTFPFTKAGNILFKGEQSVGNGTLSAQFIVPKDISYTNDLGRIALYFWNPSNDGAGYSTNVRIGGTDTTAAADNQGPVIKLYLGSRNFRPGDVVGSNPALLGDLHDEHGINTSDAGVGHRIEAWLDDKTESIDLSGYYKSNTDTYKDGTILYPLTGLSEGSHRLRLRAWDTYNNSSVAQTAFDVVTQVGLQLSNLFNYPNPFAGSTVFSFQHNQPEPVDAEVKIYTVAGRLIQSIVRKNVVDSFVRIPWDGRDKDGDRIANGVYLYKVVVKTESGRLSGEGLGKLSVVK